MRGTWLCLSDRQGESEKERESERALLTAWWRRGAPMQRRRYSHAYQRRRYPHTPLWLSLPVFLSARSEAPASAPVARRPRDHTPASRALRWARACDPAGTGTHAARGARAGVRTARACDVFCLTERAPAGRLTRSAAHSVF